MGRKEGKNRKNSILHRMLFPPLVINLSLEFTLIKQRAFCCLTSGWYERNETGLENEIHILSSVANWLIVFVLMYPIEITIFLLASFEINRCENIYVVSDFLPIGLLFQPLEHS